MKKIHVYIKLKGKIVDIVKRPVEKNWQSQNSTTIEIDKYTVTRNRICRECGCTENEEGPERTYWFEDDLCKACNTKNKRDGKKIKRPFQYFKGDS